MELLFFISALVQDFGISLGVGCSTLAVLNYIVATKDGEVDQSERQLLRIVYIMLRVAMGVVLFALFVRGVLFVTAYGTDYMHPFVLFLWTVVVMLYLNAILMTKHVIPRSVGPALQAGSWYMLGILSFFSATGVIDFTYTQLVAIYLSIIIIMMILINGVLAYFKTKLIN